MMRGRIAVLLALMLVTLPVLQAQTFTEEEYKAFFTELAKETYVVMTELGELSQRLGKAGSIFLLKAHLKEYEGYRDRLLAVLRELVVVEPPEKYKDFHREFTLGIMYYYIAVETVIEGIEKNSPVIVMLASSFILKGVDHINNATLLKP